MGVVITLDGFIKTVTRDRIGFEGWLVYLVFLTTLVGYINTADGRSWQIKC